MSRDLADTKYYISEGGTIPIKWTAPEAVYYHKYSTATDVWSFGCLLYEIWSMGHQPFVDTFDADVGFPYIWFVHTLNFSSNLGSKETLNRISTSTAPRMSS